MCANIGVLNWKLLLKSIAEYEFDETAFIDIRWMKWDECSKFWDGRGACDLSERLFL